MAITLSPNSGWKGHGLALLAGATYPLGLAPLNLWPITLLSIALLVYCLQDQPPKTAFKRGWLYGFGAYGVGVSWVYVSIHFYGNTPLPLAIGMTAFFAAGLALLFGFLGYGYVKLRLDRLPLLTFPTLWILVDWIKTWLMSGFPWLYPGYGFIDTPAKHLAPLGGIFAVSWLVVFSATLLPRLINPKYPRIFYGVILAALWGGSYGLKDIVWTQPDLKNALKVALVQGNISQERKWDPNERESIIATYVSNTEKLWDMDLVVWPEAAFPVFYHDALDVIAGLDVKGDATNTAIISGAPYYELIDGRYHYYNSIFAMGDGKGLYHKQVLVPFGEFVPFEAAIRGMLPFFDLPMSSFTEGTAEQSLLMAKGKTLAPFICYEIVYPDLVRKMGADADYLLTISNDAWFGRSWGPNQHLEMAQMRALELGKYLLRGTNTGITAIISPDGKIQASTPQFEENILKGTVYKTTGQTPFSQWGSWPVLGAALIAVVLGVGLGQRKPAESSVPSMSGIGRRRNH